MVSFVLDDLDRMVNGEVVIITVPPLELHSFLSVHILSFTVTAELQAILLEASIIFEGVRVPISFSISTVVVWL